MIHLEQPPNNTAPELSSYILRILVGINNELSKGLTVVPQDKLPLKSVEGMVRYFNDAILPEVPVKGCYIFDGTNWLLLTSEELQAQVNAIDTKVTNLEKFTAPTYSTLPTTPAVGMIGYFDTIITPDIPAVGLYWFNGTAWIVI